MDGAIGVSINHICLGAVAYLKPNFPEYASGKSFEEHWHQNDEFVHVHYYDRDIETRGDIEKSLVTTFENAERLQRDVETYIAALKEIQATTAMAQLSAYDLHTYNYFNRVGSDIGICHIHFSVRNKSREDAEAMAEEMEHQRLMREDRAYRKEQEWFASENRPYGGAFSSDADFARHVGLHVV